MLKYETPECKIMKIMPEDIITVSATTVEQWSDDNYEGNVNIFNFDAMSNWDGESDF